MSANIENEQDELQRIDIKAHKQLTKMYSGLFEHKQEIEDAVHEAQKILKRRVHKRGEVEYFRAAMLLCKAVRTIHSWQNWANYRKRESAEKKGLWKRPVWTAVGPCVWLPNGSSFQCATSKDAKFAAEQHNKKTEPEQ